MEQNVLPRLYLDGMMRISDLVGISTALFVSVEGQCLFTVKMPPYRTAALLIWTNTQELVTGSAQLVIIARSYVLAVKVSIF